MKSIRFQASRVVNTTLPTEEERTIVRRRLVEQMKAAGCVKFQPIETRDQVATAVSNILKANIVNPKATPGVPFDRLGKTKKEVLQLFPKPVLDAVTDLLCNWKLVGLDQIKLLSVSELLSNHLVYPTQTKIKQEPHSVEKLKQERYRVFFAMSMIMEIAARVLYQPILANEAEQWRSIPVKPGIGFTDEMMRDLFAYADEYLGETRESNDGSGYDWSERYYAMSDVTEATIEAYEISGWRAEAMRINTLLSFKIPWQTSDGTLLEVYMHNGDESLDHSEDAREWLVWKSGGLTTARDNSWARIYYAHLAALRLNLLEKSRAITMGDDCVETALKRNYEQFGLRITDRVETKQGEPFEFCSREIQRDGKGKLIPWTKTLYRLLSNKPNWEFITQFDHEMRNNPELSWVHKLLMKIGYFEPIKFQIQTKICGGFHLTPKIQLASLCMATRKVKKQSKASYTRNLEEAQQRDALRIRSLESRLALTTKSVGKLKKKKKVAARQARPVGPALPGIDNRILHRAAKTMNFNENAGMPMTGHLWEPFLHGMERPFETVPQKCPVSYDIAPTFRTHVARTTVTIANHTVAAGITQTLILGGVRPGGYPYLDTNQTVTDSATVVGFAEISTGAQYAMGPAPVVGDVGGTPFTANPCCVFISSPVAATGQFDIRTFNSKRWDVDLPYQGANGDSNSLRWRVTAVGIKIKNTTPMLNRGGDVWSVIPTYGVSWMLEATGTGSTAVPIGELAYEPSLKMHGYELPHLAVPIQPRHLSYVAGDYRLVTVSGSQACGAPLAMIAFANSTSVSQSYDIQIEYHWEVGGDTVFQLGSHAMHIPSAKGVIEPAIAHSTQQAKGAEGIVPVAKAVGGLISGGIPALASIAKQGVAAAGFVGKAMEALGLH